MRFSRNFAALTAICLLLGMILPFSGIAEDAAEKQEIEDFDFANGLLSRGMYEMAVSAYDGFLKKYPLSKYAEDARYRAAEATFLGKDNEKATREFSAFLESTSSPSLKASAFMRIGQINFDMGDNEAANRNLKDALQIPEAAEDTRETCEYYLAEILLKEGKVREARDAFETILERYKDGSYSGFAGVSLGDIYFEEKEFKKAAEVYKYAGERIDDAALKDEAYLREAEALGLSGEITPALEKYRGILTASSDAGTRSRAALGIISVNYNSENSLEVIREAKELLPGISDQEIAFHVKFLMANSYLNTDQFSEAREVYEEISGKCGAETIERRVKLNNCWALYKLEKYEQSLEEAEAYLVSFPGEDADEALYLKGKAHGSVGMWDKAIEDYEILLEKYKDSVFRREALYDLAWACYQAGNLEAGLAAHKSFVDTFPEDERSPGVLLKVAQEDLKSGKYEIAIGLYKKFLSDYEKDPQKQFAMYQMARAFYEAGQYEEAIKTYDGILEDFPFSEITGNVFYWRALSYQKTENWDAAIKDFRDAANKGGELAVKASEAVAFSLFQKGEETAAAEAYYAIISETIGTHAGIQKGIYLWTAEFYTEKKEHEKALEVLRALEKAYPGQTDSEVLYLLGENSRLTGQDGAAIDYFEKAINSGALSPRKERCYLGMGRAFVKLGDREKAVQSLEKALEGDRDNVTGAMARLEMGDIYARENNFAEAARQYAMVAILYDDKELSPKALYMAANAFKKAGMSRDAEKLFNELLSKFPQNPLAEKAKKEIEGTNE